MLTPTHIAVVVLVAMLLRLDKNEWFIAVLFGIVIDVDHLFALPRYVSANGWSAVLNQSWDDSSGLPWKSWFHYPMAAIVVGHLSLGWRFALPLAFWSIHLGMDGLQQVLGDLNMAVESAMLLGASAGIVFLTYSDWSLVSGRTGLRAYADHVASSSRAMLSGLRGIV